MREMTDDERAEQGERNRDEESDRYAHERYENPVYVEARNLLARQEMDNLDALQYPVDRLEYINDLDARQKELARKSRLLQEKAIILRNDKHITMSYMYENISYELDYKRERFLKELAKARDLGTVVRISNTYEEEIYD